MNKPIEYFQNDNRWGSADYSASGEKTTIGKAGCGPTSAAMVVATVVDPSETPLKAAKWALQRGYKAKNQGTYYVFFVPYFRKFGLTCKQLTTSSVYHNPKATVHKKVMQELRKGNLVIACMGKGIWTSSGHFILAYGIDDKRVYINDPASKKDMRRCNFIETWQNEVKHYWVIEVPKVKPIQEDDEVVEKLKMAVLGKDSKIDGIFKEGSNYVNLRQFCELLGLEITSKGKEPIVSMSTVKMRIDGNDKVLSGMNAGGTAYVGARAFAESMDKKVGWDSEENRVVIE